MAFVDLIYLERPIESWYYHVTGNDIFNTTSQLL